MAIVFQVCLAMLAFAANSLLCRMALSETQIDPASFTTIRLVSGAITLSLLVFLSGKGGKPRGNVKGSVALFVYAAAFSFAYVQLATGTGALLLFGAVQLTMLLVGLWRGERFHAGQWLGFGLAVVGVVVLLFPGITAPPAIPALLMISAGIAWGIYSLLGKGASSPLLLTAGNFIFTVPMAVALSLMFSSQHSWDVSGIIYAVMSGALASGVGYAIWYKVLPAISATHAATFQLSVPVIATLAGWLLLGESLTMRIVLASIAVLGGIALVITTKHSDKGH